MPTNGGSAIVLHRMHNVNGLIYNCLPTDVIFNFSPPICVEQASMLDHLGFHFCFAGVLVANKCCLFLLISQRIGLG